ncbi:MAG: ATP-binding cassette domain-containing protein [Thermoplasmata archaeon]
MDAIATDNLTMKYGSLVALDHVSIKIPNRSIFGLLGPNGAGKTTMIKLLTGLVRPTEGDAVVAGYSVRKDPYKVKERIGWVAAEVILDDDLTAWENLWLQAKLQNQKDWQSRARDLLAYFSLTDRMKDRVGRFSTGMRKKLEIALALLHQPSVIFMDEPTIGLDPATRGMLWELTRGINREFGVTIFLTTHYIEEADALCETLGILERGKIVALGSPSELKSRVGGDLIELETVPPMDVNILRGLAGVQDVRDHGKSVILKVGSAEQTLPALLRVLPADGVKRVNVEKPNLETVYLDLTGRRLTEDDTHVDVRKFYTAIRRARQ